MKTTSKKPSGQSLENAREIHKAGGAIASGDWTRGTGNFVSKRPIPTGCAEIERTDLEGFRRARTVESLPERTLAAIESLFKSRPRVKRAIVLMDWSLFDPETDLHYESMKAAFGDHGQG